MSLSDCCYFFLRALDTSGGYLDHTPEFAAKVIIACACLHNVARDRKLDMPPDVDQFEDGFVPRYARFPEPPLVPPPGRQQYNSRRAQYIRWNFRRQLMCT